MSVAKKLAKKSIDEKLLKKLVPLDALGTDRLRELAEKADIEHLSPGRTLFKRGDTDTKTYYLLSGDLEVQLAGGQSVLIKADTPAALHPLLDARPRPATAVVKSNASFLVIDTGLLDILVNYDRRQSYEVNEISAQDESDWLTRFLQSLSAMNIPVKNIEHLMQRMQELAVRSGEIVIRQTDTDSQHYYVVKEGRCVVTKQATEDKTSIRIAELAAGIGFGEEALLADQPRNASVTMLTDGRLMRLAKADFTQLIADPALHYVTYLQAQQMIETGAVWLDTRSDTEHRDNTIIGSIHIPLMALRTKVKELNAYGKYIVFCDSGNRAASAAFLLRQMGFAAYVLTDGLHTIPAAALRGKANTQPAKLHNPAAAETRPSTTPTNTTARIIPKQLKVQPQTADTTGDTHHLAEDPERVRMEESRWSLAHAEIEQLRAQLATARAGEQDVIQRLAQLKAVTLSERDAAKAEQARMQLHIAKLEAAVASQQERDGALQAQVNEYNLSLSVATAAHESMQKELDGLSHTHTRVLENLKNENLQLQTRVVATTAVIEQVKTELEHEVERNRTAEEALLGAEREIARLQAEANAAQRHAEELSRRASESESLQSTILKEVQRKIEAAELMRIEAEEQTQHLREAAELSRKRAEQESRKVAEAEAARAKAQEESERRARLTEDIRKKAEEEVARLKKEAESARASADEALKKSQLADTARRRLELEMQAQLLAQSKSTEKNQIAGTPPDVANDLDDLERELAQLQQKLESKKRAAVARNQQAHQAAEKNRTAEAGVVQNVYDLHQKTQKLPVFKPNQAAPNDVGKVRKSGWISDSILWETTIGLREDTEAEKFLDNENMQRATATVAPTKRQEPNIRALSSGEIKSQEAKRSVFTARESAPTIQQQHREVPGRSPGLGLIMLLSAGAVAITIGAYVLLHKSNDVAPKITTSVPQATPLRTTPDAPANPPAAGKTQAIETTPETAKSTNTNGAITRKEALVPNAVSDSSAAKPKAETKLPARKPVPADPVLDSTPANTAEPSNANMSGSAPIPENPGLEVSPALELEPSATPAARSAPAPINTLPATGIEPEERTPPAELAPTEITPVVPTFTDAPPVN